MEANLAYQSSDMPATTGPSYLDKLKASRVSESLLVDAIEAYANERCTSALERDEFISQMSEDPYAPLMKKAVLDVVFTIIAASELPTDTAFRELVDSLGVTESDELIRAVKRTFLMTMADVEDAFDGDISERQFQDRVAYVADQITHSFM